MANNFYTYKIVFDDGEGGNEAPASPSRPENQNEINPKNPTEKKDKGNKTSVGTAIAVTMFQKLGSSSVSFATSNIERWTGSAVAQDNINTAMKVAGYGMAFATNWKIALATLVVDTATTVYNYNYELNLRNKQYMENARRLGMLNNRSR